MLSELWPDKSWQGRRAPTFVVCRHTGDRPRLRVSGDLDATSSADLHDAFVAVLRQHCPPGVDLDLEGVTYLDSAGLTGLLLCRDDARQMGCDLALRNTPTMVYRILQVAGLLEDLGLARPPVPPAVPGTGGAAMGFLSSRS
jgi:anti-anti-sigma factor